MHSYQNDVFHNSFNMFSLLYLVFEVGGKNNGILYLTQTTSVAGLPLHHLACIFIGTDANIAVKRVDAALHTCDFTQVQVHCAEKIQNGFVSLSTCCFYLLHQLSWLETSQSDCTIQHVQHTCS